MEEWLDSFVGQIQLRVAGNARRPGAVRAGWRRCASQLVARGMERTWRRCAESAKLCPHGKHQYICSRVAWFALYNSKTCLLNMRRWRASHIRVVPRDAEEAAEVWRCGARRSDISITTLRRMRMFWSISYIHQAAAVTLQPTCGSCSVIFGMLQPVDEGRSTSGEFSGFLLASYFVHKWIAEALNS